MEEASVSIRLNPFKGLDGPAGAPVPWSPYGRILSERPTFTLDPLFHAGCYYVQDSSAMFVGHLFRKLISASGEASPSQDFASLIPPTSAGSGELPGKRAHQLRVGVIVLPHRCAGDVPLRRHGPQAGACGAVQQRHTAIHMTTSCIFYGTQPGDESQAAQVMET